MRILFSHTKRKVSLWSSQPSSELSQPQDSTDLSYAGGAQAIEDAISIAALLPNGTPASVISERLKLYEGQRYERSHRIQEFTRLSGADLKDGKELDVRSFTAYNVGHDEWDASTAALRQHLAASDPKAKWRSPVSFGPTPQVPKEDRQLKERLLVRFKSSKTYLETLLPPGFAFVSPATLCDASLACDSFQDHTAVKLRIHGVSYARRNGGEPLFGSFVPVVFHDLPDLNDGLSTVFTDTTVSRTDSDATVRIGRRESDICTIHVHQLSVEVPAANGVQGRPAGPPPPPDNGDFYWRYVPGLGGEPDAEYPVFVPKRESGVDKEWTSKDASIQFQAGAREHLPTLYHITSWLSQLPVYSIVSAKCVEFTQAEDDDETSRAYQIE